MIDKELVTGMPRFAVEKETCEACLREKQIRTSFPQTSSYRVAQVLELVHGDLCGPISPPTAGRNRYVFVLIDDYSRYMWTILMKEKSEAFTKFKFFKATVEAEIGTMIKILRTDRGGEFTSLEFREFCDSPGIKRHLIAPRSTSKRSRGKKKQSITRDDQKYPKTYGRSELLVGRSSQTRNLPH